MWNRRNVDTDLHLTWTCIFWLSLSRNRKDSLGLWPRQDLILDHSGRIQGLGVRMFPRQTANITQSASLEGILQFLSGGKVKTARRGWKKEQAGGEEKQEEGIRHEQEVRTHELWSQHTKQPWKYINITDNQKDFGGPFCYNYFLSLSLSSCLAPCLFSINFTCRKVLGISINQPSLLPFLFNI